MELEEMVKNEIEAIDIHETEEPDQYAVHYTLTLLDLLEENGQLDTPWGKELQKKVLYFAPKFAPFVKGGPPNGQKGWWWQLEKIVEGKMKVTIN